MEERLWKHGRFSFVFMFEKISKRFGSKAADSAVEGVKETLNDKLEDYSGIIKIGLVLAVIIFGGKHLIKQEKDNSAPVFNPKLPSGGQPIIINNYYHEPKGDWIEYGGQRKNYQKHQNRR